MYKLLIKLSIVLLILIVGFFTLVKLNILPDFFNFSKLFGKKEISIEPSAVIVENVSPLAQLFTSTYYSEFPISEVKKTDAFFGLSKSNNENYKIVNSEILNKFKVSHKKHNFICHFVGKCFYAAGG